MPSCTDGKTVGREDPSTRKEQRQRDENRDEGDMARSNTETANQQTYIDAREWQGQDLNLFVEKGALTLEQAASIMQLRRAVGKRKASQAELEGEQEDGRSDEAVTEP